MSKEQILQLLKENQDSYISGQAISRRLGISRAAIWKGVDALRRNGYAIDGRSALGYRLTAAPDIITPQEISSFLPEGYLSPDRLLVLDSVDSTNTYLKRASLSGAADGAIVIADHQTGGRGRLGRAFESPAGKGIYLSVLMRPDLPPQATLSATGLCAVAMRRAIEKSCGVCCGIKWTNDLIAGGKKVCGILTEMALEGESGRLQHMIMGVGINVHHGIEDFSPEVRSLATSLDLAAGKTFSRSRLAAAMIEELDALRDVLEGRQSAAEYLADYRRHCVTLGKEARLMWREGAEKVLALDIDEEFGLIIRHEDGREEVIRSGEVSVRGLYGYID